MNMRQAAFVTVLVCFSFGAVGAAPGQDRAPSYQLPPQVMADLVDAPSTPDVLLSPDREKLLVMQGENLPPISELSQPELRLAGIRINPSRFGPSRARYFRKATLLRIADGKEQAIHGIPSQGRILRASWSADSRYIAFFVVEGERIQLWVGDSARAEARLIDGVRLNATLSSWPCKWVSDRHELACLTVPSGLGEPQQAPRVPGGPVIQQTSGGKAAARTYQDLLKNAHDENLFEYYASSQVVRVTLDGKVEKLGEAGLHTNAEPSPDGNYLLVEQVRRPFSRLVPAYRFARRAQVWDRGGKMVRQLADPASGRTSACRPRCRAHWASRLRLARGCRRHSPLDGGSRRRRPLQQGGNP